MRSMCFGSSKQEQQLNNTNTHTQKTDLLFNVLSAINLNVFVELFIMLIVFNGNSIVLIKREFIYMFIYIFA